MLNRILVAGLIIFAFGAGYFIGRPSEDVVTSLEENIRSLEQSKQELVDRNQNLEQTLDLVKRQIQTDRIAYESLKKTVDAAEQERVQMQEKFQAQRELLERLKKKLEEL